MIRKFADFIAVDMTTDEVVAVAIGAVPDPEALATRGEVATAAAELFALAVQAEEESSEELTSHWHRVEHSIASLERRLAVLETAFPRTAAA